MFLFHKVKKAAALCAVLLVVCTAAGAQEYDELIQNGDADAIASALQADKKMKKASMTDRKP